ncbi:phosphotransferase [Thermoactinomyces daqus]|uniref:Phosphotransferase n=1 Tax=Thermoactinomyces daqus TaxID=1329516 RepID=A0A7W1X793_9BACL|nr:phosphotransferase [Thermoactinomyces daqus]MBA4541368.1 phosphotransferase [Thermoactinomyces daqus]
MKRPRRELLERILHTEVRNITPYRRNWYIETAQMHWIAKRMHTGRLQWWCRVDNELRQRGFQAMLPICSDGQNWLLTPFIKGKSGKYSRLEDVKSMVKILAAFHQTGRELWTPPRKEAAFLLYQRVAERLARFYQVLRRVNKVEGDLGKLLVKVGKDFYLEGLRCWEKLERLPLKEFCYQEYERRCLAHRDLASHNWLIGEDRTIWLIDFETADYDCQAGDVWQMASRMLTENDWNEDCGEMFLNAYESVRPLSWLEKKIIATLFQFPNDFFREVVGLAEKKRNFYTQHSLPYLVKIIEHRDKWKEFCKGIVYW